MKIFQDKITPSMGDRMRGKHYLLESTEGNTFLVRFLDLISSDLGECIKLRFVDTEVGRIFRLYINDNNSILCHRYKVYSFDNLEEENIYRYMKELIS